MAGVAFRIQNATNYYVVRASSLGNNLRFYKVLNGERGPVIGPSVPVPSGVWHELTVECKGNAIRCLLDGKELLWRAFRGETPRDQGLTFADREDAPRVGGEDRVREGHAS